MAAGRAALLPPRARWHLHPWRRQQLAPTARHSSATACTRRSRRQAGSGVTWTQERLRCSCIASTCTSAPLPAAPPAAPLSGRGSRSRAGSYPKLHKRHLRAWGAAEGATHKCCGGGGVNRAGAWQQRGGLRGLDPPEAALYETTSPALPARGRAWHASAVGTQQQPCWRPTAPVTRASRAGAAWHAVEV